jgi:HprK-related kinase B
MTALTASACRERLIDGQRLLDTVLDLSIGGWRTRIRSNDPRLLTRLSRYFAPYATPHTVVDAEIVAIECPAPELGLAFVDWRREPGKTGRKDSYRDLPDARLVRKVRTGMVFLQHERWRIAAGPCLDNDNQVINFINSQYMNHLQQRGWLICHAAALARDGRALGLAGFSGGGKSTLMLRLMEEPAWHYLTNDRLLVRQHSGTVECRGIPKMPRVNPGTLLHNPRLSGLVDRRRAAALRSLPPAALWSIEE